MLHASLIAGLLLASLVISQSEAILNTTQSFPLHHRFFPSSPLSNTSTDWHLRGNLLVKPQSFPSVPQVTYEEAGDSVPSGPGVDGDGEGWYQVRVEMEEGAWPMASTKACFLADPSDLVLVLQLDDSTPTSISIHETNSPQSGECHPAAKDRHVQLPHTKEGSRIIVQVRTPQKIYAPGLAPPPVVDAATGLPTPPPVEKSFLQKYWLPLIGVGLFLISQLGSDPAPAAGGGGGGGGK